MCWAGMLIMVMGAKGDFYEDGKFVFMCSVGRALLYYSISTGPNGSA
jgi:hypothetical protein